jgi:alkanesulfonate monooxygenase SsuD/methylene tetrahydromethanopterin reductase-like flavin-dependent oxidoreductase (luciferase family)
MSTNLHDRVGLAFTPNEDALSSIDLIRRADQAGVSTVWLIMPASGLDIMSIFAAALPQTEQIRVGTAILPAFTRHPITTANQVRVLEQIRPGSVRLGLGTAHARTMVDVFHFPFNKPLSQLREYLEVVKPLLQDGEAHFKGDFYHVDVSIPQPTGTPVYIAALRAPAFTLAGSHSDGAISWNCPVAYLKEHSLPAMARGAEAAGRPVPPLLAHVPVVNSADPDAVYAAAHKALAYYKGAPFYARMWADAGFPVDENGDVTNDLIDELVVSGTEDQIREKLIERLDAGLDELLVHPMFGPDRRADEEAFLRILGDF